MKTINKKFESLSGLTSFIANNSPCGYFADVVSLSSVDGSKKFTGTASYEEADGLMLHGWKEGADRVKNYMMEAKMAKGERAVNYNSVVGFAPNVPNYLAGNPLNMINRKRVNAAKRVVTICYNCAVEYGVKSEAIERAAAKLFNVVSGLEAAGVRVELWVANFCNTITDGQFNMAVKIKTASQPFNLLKMIYPVVHPSFLRRHVLGAIERAGVEGSGWCNYGRPIIAGSEMKKACDALRIPSGNVINYYSICNKTEKEISGMIK